MVTLAMTARDGAWAAQKAVATARWRAGGGTVEKAVAAALWR
jgi:hypothetical protein